MGCCVSSGIQKGDKGHLGTRSPPVEEETVKEVLSETRIVPKVEDGGVKGSTPPAWKVEFGPAAVAVVHNSPRRVITQERKVNVEEKKPTAEIVSESSEMLSYSESLSNAAAPVEKKDADEEGGVVVDQRPPVRKPRAPTPTRNNGTNGERVHSRKPVASSPERRTPTAAARGGRGRIAVEQPRTVGEERIPSRDPGEGSARRSRTPVRRTDSPARRNATDEKSVAVTAPSNDAVTTGEESLDNPVVSLECFIFL